MKKTLRITFPQWQGGVNPQYVFGSELLSVIAPPNAADEAVTIAVARNFNEAQAQVDGIDCGEALLAQQKETARILEEREPDRVIIFGGDCAVTQVPFDYLRGRYSDKIGILWLDAHPDISSIQHSTHLHEMVLGNLLGLQPSSALTKVNHPYDKEQVMFGGLIEEQLREMDMACKRLQLRIASPEELARSSRAVIEWIAESGIQYIAVHWDLDVLSPIDFRSIYPAEPYTDPEKFPAAVGRMTLQQIGRILQDCSTCAEIVGLSITEHLPWDAFRLRKTLEGISIFQS